MSSDDYTPKMIWDEERTKMVQAIILRRCQWWALKVPKLLIDFASPADLAQEVWVKRFKNIDSWEPAGACSFNTWIYRQTTYAIKRHLWRLKQIKERTPETRMFIEVSYDPFGIGSAFHYRDLVVLADIYGWKYIPDAVRHIVQGNNITETARFIGVTNRKMQIELKKFEKWAKEQAA